MLQFSSTSLNYPFKEDFSTFPIFKNVSNKLFLKLFPLVFPQASLWLQKNLSKKQPPHPSPDWSSPQYRCCFHLGVHNGGKSRSAGDFNVSNKQQEKNRHKKQRKKQTTWTKIHPPPTHKKNNTTPPKKNRNKITGGTPTPLKRKKLWNFPLPRSFVVLNHQPPHHWNGSCRLLLWPTN